MSELNCAVLTPGQLIADLLVEVPRANSRVVAQSMSFGAGPKDEFSTAILDVFKAVPAGVQKELYLDWYSRMVTGQSIEHLNLRIPGLRGRALEAVLAKRAFHDQFRQAGVDLRYVNPPKSWWEQTLPIYGRDHLKGINIDDKIFYFGKLNLDDITASCTDFMVKFTDHRSRVFSQVLDQIHGNQVSEDMILSLDDLNCLYVDAGNKGQSVIYDQALYLAKRAQKSLYLTAALVPSAEWAEVLAAKSRQGLTVEVLTSKPPLKTQDLLAFENLVWLNDRVTRFKNFFKGSPDLRNNPFRGVHASLLIIDQEQALVTTHNLSERGVLAGTREWGLVSSDPRLMTNLTRQYHDFRLETRNNLSELF